MNQYLDRTLNWLGAYQAPVIVLSATLPEKRRAELVEAYLNGYPEEETTSWRTARAYPLLTWTEGRRIHQIAGEQGGEERTVEIRGLDDSECLSCLRKAASDGACCGVIMNTVQAAQKLLQEVSKLIPEAEVLLLHSRFVATDRAGKESQLLQRAGKDSKPTDRAGLIVIGTQVLEQSLDIDFDVLITQLCPMDLLLQRIGRLHRHKRERPDQFGLACCYVLGLNKESDNGSRAVYGDWLLLRTRELLPNRISLPKNIPDLVQETYRDPGDEFLYDEMHLEAWEKHKQLRAEKRIKADNYRVPSPKRDSARRAKTIDGWLKASYPVDGVRGEARVRDCEASITVLVMQERSDGYIGFLPWQEHNAAVSASHVPDEETARKIAKQRLNLPQSFSSFGREEETIRELETLNRKKLPEWQNSGWLNGELILLLDDRLQANLCGQTIFYSEKYGLVCIREEEQYESLF